MNTTNFLLVVIIWLLVNQFYPDWVPILLLVLVVAALIRGGVWFFERRRRQTEERKQQESDQEAYQVYQRQHQAIRDRYDPQSVWNEATSLPREYLEEIRELNDRYHDLLVRRFGPEWDEE